jgi:ABC-2 type transport system permease protein
MLPRRTPHEKHDHISISHPRRDVALGAFGSHQAAARWRPIRLSHVRVAGAPENKTRPRAALRRHRIPGILVQTVVFITIYTGFGLNTDITKGVFDRFRSLPIWRPAALVGALLGDAARYTMASTMVVVLGLVLGFRPDGGVLGVLLSVALLLVFSFALSWIWTALGLVLRTPNSVMGVSMMVLFPLTFASNIFVDPRTMPPWLEAIVGANPITHLATAVRGLMHGTVTAGQIGWVLVSCGALVAVFAPLTMYLYRNKN